jgi:hypothetical protein
MSTSTETDWAGLLPSAVSARVIESAIKQSVVLALAARQPMPTGVETVPVVSVAPQAGWVAAGGRKPIAKVEWSAETLKAEGIAAVAAIPDVYISDTAGSWDPEASVEAELAKAIGRALDAAVLWGPMRRRRSRPAGSPLRRPRDRHANKRVTFAGRLRPPVPCSDRRSTATVDAWAKLRAAASGSRRQRPAPK